VQPDRIGAGFRTTEKMQCSKPSLSLDLHQALGNLRGAIGFHRLEGEMVFRHRVAVYAEPQAQSQPCKVLISCLRVV
jgi:hypothetical protein